MLNEYQGRDAYVGIDLAIAKRKALPIVFVVRDANRVVPVPLQKLVARPPRGHGNAAVLNLEVTLSFVEQAAIYLQKVEAELGVHIKRIAIDAPRAPAISSRLRRESEVALGEMGVSCFTTPSRRDFDLILEKVGAHLEEGGSEARIPHANQLWMLVGFELFDRLSRIAECLEVYPQLTVHLLDAARRHKTLDGAVEDQLAAAAAHTGWPAGLPEEPQLEDIGFGSLHDRLDAYLASWVAALPETGRIAVGKPPNDAIWAPRLDAPSFQVAAPKRRGAQPDISDEPSYQPAKHQRICPACGEHEFKRWPFGWDSHAAHRCPGLTATGPAERKAEFKRRFSALFS